MLRQMVFAVSIYVNGMYSGNMWGEGVSVHCELGVECVLTGLCCVLDDVLGY